MSSGFKITNNNEIQKLLREVAPRVAMNIMRASVHGVVSEIAKDAKRNAPKGRSGVLRRAIKSRRNKIRKGVISSSVIVTRGKGTKSNGWYWRFVAKGTKKTKKNMFIDNAFDNGRENLEKNMRANFSRKYESAMKREAKKTKR